MWTKENPQTVGPNYSPILSPPGESKRKRRLLSGDCSRTGYIPDLSGLGSNAFIKVELHPFPAQVFLCVCVRVCTQKVCCRLCTTGLGWTGQGGQRTAVAQSLGELGQCSRASRNLRSNCLIQNLTLKINVPLFFFFKYKINIHSLKKKCKYYNGAQRNHHYHHSRN